MNKEKQIEEMAKDLCSDIGVAIVIVCKREDGTVNLANSEKYLKNLVNKGYRKASEVALEVLDSTKDKLLEYFNNEDKRYNTSVTKSKKQFDIATARYRAISEVVKLVIVDIYAELKKKYTEGKNG